MIKVLKYSALLFGLAALVFFSYLKYGIDCVLTPEGHAKLDGYMEDTQPFNDNYYSTLKRYLPFTMSGTVNQAIITRVSGYGGHYSSCLDIYLPIVLDYTEDAKTTPFYRYIIAYYLEGKYGEKSCHELDMYSTEFGHNTSGIEEAAAIYFDSSVDSLSREEIIGLNLISRAPFLFNPIENPENFEYAINNILGVDSVSWD